MEQRMNLVADGADARGSTRTRVFHRTRAALPGGASAAMTLVDLSAGGFMARCEAAVIRGDRLTLDLPVVGRVAVEVRWALGGRFGCRFERPLADDMLAGMLPAMRGANDV